MIDASCALQRLVAIRTGPSNRLEGDPRRCWLSRTHAIDPESRSSAAVGMERVAVPMRSNDIALVAIKRLRKGR